MGTLTPAAKPVDPNSAPAAPIVPAVAPIVAKTDDAVEAKKGSYTVAPGRTIDGKMPGDKVDLDATDAKRLLGLGFILDKDGSVVVRADGPAVNVEDGVQIAQPAA